MNKDYNLECKQVSGNIKINCKLTSFLYTLMRDHIPTSVVEALSKEADYDDDVVYTNGWLALYANHIAKRLIK